jgi:hypothetical protein
MGLYVLPQLFERRPIQSRTAVAVVDVFLDEHVARAGDLSLELEHLTLNGSFFLLRVCAHACVQHRSFHTTPLIFQSGAEESNRGVGINQIIQTCRLCKTSI